MMKRMAVAAAALAVAGLAVSARAADSLANGTAVAPFHVKAVTGAHKGEDLCYRCALGNAPVVCIFAAEMNDKVVAAVQTLDQRMGADKNLKGFFVKLSDDCSACEAALGKLAAEKGIKHLPLTVFKGMKGPEEYKLDPAAGVTVLMWNAGKVAHGKAYAKGAFCNECCGHQVDAFVAKLGK